MTIKRNTQNVTVTLERDLLNRAREAGVNMSATLAAALDAELKKYVALRWQEDNAEAIATMNALGEETGCFSDEYRNF
ncbi:type II toxin-antitoxin system CcdA family antitoxin [Yokenella regensburgei]|uniref:type II toxin-antitoxin system CcdA family antitoxin n=1 Tax=Yokenella regensburgei TaxID=158877 RepID=UPI003ED96AF5